MSPHSTFAEHSLVPVKSNLNAEMFQLGLWRRDAAGFDDI